VCVTTLALGGLAPPAPAAAATSTVASPIQAFVPDTITITQGDSLQYVNIDVSGVARDGLHDLTSTSRVPGPNGTLVPRFASASVQPGNVTAVVGVEALPAGTWFFYCTQHEQMRGTLKVTGG